MWRTNVRGRIWIHASAGTGSNEEYLAAIESVCEVSGIDRSSLPGLRLGGIVGSVEIVDCVTASESPWFVGPFGFVLRNPTRCAFIPCKGKLGFWEAPSEAQP